MRILWSPQSLRDLDAIHEYIAKDSEHYAGLTIARIFSAVEQLIQFPRSGRIVPERDEPEIREVNLGRFRVVYRLQDELIEVATVFRAAREFPRKILRCGRVAHRMPALSLSNRPHATLEEAPHLDLLLQNDLFLQHQ